MLQQTRVETVVPYFERFVGRFPDLASLAQAPEDAVLQLWSGLGYYARARNLLRAARAIVEQHAGRFPSRHEDIAALPGIGRSTAGAIGVFAFGARRAILDGNVKRVLARHFGIEGFPGERTTEQRLWAQAEAALPAHSLPAYTQGLMDLGAMLCSRARPRCEACPVSASCVARREARTQTLPAPRPTRSLRQRTTRMLILICSGEILLEKRPPAGIWGGLWCFPELPAESEPQEAAHLRFGAQVSAAQSLPTIAHAFTHFLLQIQPLLCTVQQRLPRAQEAGCIWIALEEARTAAVPAPVRRILERLPAALPHS
jgi:A/G-specific adenine glycosylase